MRALWLSGAGTLLLCAALAAYLAPLDPGVLALQFAFTPRAFGDIVHRWPPELLARYRAHLPVDCLLLVCYGSFGWLLVTRTPLFAATRQPLRLLLAWLLPLAAGCDAVENALHWWLTAVPRFGVPLPYLAAAVAAAAKWLLLLAFALVVAWALLVPGRPTRFE